MDQFDHRAPPEESPSNPDMMRGRRVKRSAGRELGISPDISENMPPFFLAIASAAILDSDERKGRDPLTGHPKKR